jgi:hypothetical protein
MRNTYLLPLILLFFIGVFTDANAQRKTGTKKRETTTTPKDTRSGTNSSRSRAADSESLNLLQRLNTDIKAGSLTFTGNIFSIAAKVNTGYKVTDWFSAGVAGKYRLLLFNEQGQANDQSFHDYGFGVYSRAKIFQQFYAQVEYDINNLARQDNGFLIPGARETQGGLYLGGGILQGWGDWKFGAELLFIMNDRIRDYNGFAEYWFQASYNF